MNELDRYAVSLENMEVLRAQVDELEAWKAEELALMNPLMDYARSVCTGPLGCSITGWLVEDHQKQAREIAALKAQPSAMVMPALRGDSDNPGELMFNRGHDHALAEVARLNPARGVPERWMLAADQKPQTGKAVMAYYTNSHGMGRRIRAEYIAAWAVQAEDVSDPDTECVEYSEQDDAYYLTAGWYELVDNWDEYGRIAVTEGVITHWMPMPAAPSPAPVEPAHSDVSVPRELLSCYLSGEGGDWVEAGHQLRALLNGGRE